MCQGLDAIEFVEARTQGLVGDHVAAGRERCLMRERTHQLFRRILGEPERRRRWRFNQSPLFLEFLVGARDYDCTPWGNPTFGIFGWQKPCYLLQDGYAASFQELLGETRWQSYGPAAGDPRCRDCMLHSGFEASAVDEGFASLRGFLAMARAALRGPRVPARRGLGRRHELLREVAGEPDSNRNNSLC